MKTNCWSRLIFGLLVTALFACQPLVDDDEHTTRTKQSSTKATGVAQRPTNPATTKTKPTSSPPAKPTAVPTIGAPEGWQWVGGQSTSLQLAIPPDWLNLSPQLNISDATDQLGLITLFLVSDEETGENLMAQKPLNQGAFITASLAELNLPETTPTQRLEAMLTQVMPDVVPYTSPESATAITPNGPLAGAVIDLPGHPMSFFTATNQNLKTRLYLFSIPGHNNRQAIFLLSTPTTLWPDYTPSFAQIAETIIIYNNEETGFTLSGGEAHFVGRLTEQELFNVSLSRHVRDIWTFDTNNARYATLTLSPDDVSLDLKLTIVSPSGETVAAIDNGYSGDTEIATDILLTEEGRYVVEVSEFLEQSGWYTLQLTLSDVPLYSGGGYIASGQTIQSVLPANDRHFWNFDGAAGQLVSIVLLPTDEKFDAILDLYGPDGERLIALDEGFTGDAEIISGFELPLTGEYIILVRNFTNSAGAYTISLNQGKDETQNFYEAGDLVYGDVRSENLQAFEAHAWYFQGKADDQVMITVSPKAPQLDLDIWLFDPNLERILVEDSTLANGIETVETALPLEGQYIVLVRDFYGESGEYEISLEAMPTQPPEYSGMLTYGQPVTNTLLPDQRVVWLFSAQADEVVDIFIFPTDPESDLILALEDPEGRTVQEVDTQSAGGIEIITDFVLPSSGDWRIVVKSFLDEGGNYALLVEQSRRR